MQIETKMKSFSEEELLTMKRASLQRLCKTYDIAKLNRKNVDLIADLISHFAAMTTKGKIVVNVEKDDEKENGEPKIKDNKKDSVETDECPKKEQKTLQIDEQPEKIEKEQQEQIENKKEVSAVEKSELEKEAAATDTEAKKDDNFDTKDKKKEEEKEEDNLETIENYCIIHKEMQRSIRWGLISVSGGALRLKYYCGSADDSFKANSSSVFFYLKGATPAPEGKTDNLVCNDCILKNRGLAEKSVEDKYDVRSPCQTPGNKDFKLVLSKTPGNDRRIELCSETHRCLSVEMIRSRNNCSLKKKQSDRRVIRRKKLHKDNDDDEENDGESNNDLINRFLKLNGDDTTKLEEPETKLTPLAEITSEPKKAIDGEE